jgi:hypothetical protein
VRVETVSGNAEVTGAHPPSADAASQRLRYTSTSGALVYRGACGPRCRLEARTMSGDLHFHVAQPSSFELHYLTHGGELADRLGLDKQQAQHSAQKTRLRGRYGAGEGLIEAQTWTGNLAVAAVPAAAAANAVRPHRR